MEYLIPKEQSHIDWTKKRTSNVWNMLLCPETDIRLDSDAWNRRSDKGYFFFYEEEISMQEFVQRIIMSTTTNLDPDAWWLTYNPEVKSE